MPRKRKNAHGEGNVYRQNGTNNSNCTKWMIVIPLGKVDGKYKQRKKRFEGTYTQAMAKKRQMLLERDNKSVVEMDGTLGEWLDSFYQKRRDSGNFAQRTLITDACNCKTLKLHLGNVKFADLDAEVINGAYSKLRSGKSVSGKRLSGTSLLSAHKALKFALKEPMKRGDIDPNLFDGVIAPVGDTKEKKPLTNRAVNELINKLDPNVPRYMALLFCLALGLRQSESVGVRWEDIDFEIGVLHLCRSLNPDATEKDPKTFSGTRDLPLMPFVIEALKIRRKAQERVAQMVAGAYNEGEPYDKKIYKKVLASMIYVCSDEAIPIRPGIYQSWWHYHRRKLGISCTMHELRHTFLTMLARAKVHPRVMQELGGHKTFDITMSIYTHVDMAEKEEAAKALNIMLLKSKCAQSSDAERAIIALNAAASMLKETLDITLSPAQAPSLPEELILEGYRTLKMLLEKAKDYAAEQNDIINLDGVANQNGATEMVIPFFEQVENLEKESNDDYSCQFLLTA